MLLTILARMSNDEQRWQLLQTLRNKLSHYHLDWLDLRTLLDFFSKENQIRWDILQFLLLHMNNSTKKMEINDYIYLSDHYTNNNEQVKVQLFEQIYSKLNIRNHSDFQCIINLFSTINIRQKIETIIRTNVILDQYEELDNEQLSSFQLTVSPEQTVAHNILSPTLSSVQKLSCAPLKRKYSYDDQYHDHPCHQIITPSFIIQQDEFIQQQDLLSSISISSSNSSLSSASEENIPIRNRSFMIAIKNTFERLKETSS